MMLVMLTSPIESFFMRFLDLAARARFQPYELLNFQARGEPFESGPRHSDCRGGPLLGYKRA
jgi:hypothetical protein